jgi:hypothetical protein
MKLHMLTTVDHTFLYKLYQVSLLTQFQLVVNRIMQITCTILKEIIMQITCTILKEIILPVIALSSHITNKSLI